MLSVAIRNSHLYSHGKKDRECLRLTKISPIDTFGYMVLTYKRKDDSIVVPPQLLEHISGSASCYDE